MERPTKTYFLAQLGAIDSETNCPICPEEPPTLPFTTVCKHTFCRECIRNWSKDHSTCPVCRRELYRPDPYGNEGGDPDNVSEHVPDDNANNNPINAPSALEVALEIDRMTLTFGVDQDAVRRRLMTFLMEDRVRAHQVGLVVVNHQTLVETAVAAILYLRRRREELGSLEGAVHDIWKAVAEHVHTRLLSVDTQQLNTNDLWSLLFDATYEANRPFRHPDSRALPSYHGDAYDGVAIMNDMSSFRNMVVQQAQRNYIEMRNIRTDESNEPAYQTTN